MVEIESKPDPLSWPTITIGGEPQAFSGEQYTVALTVNVPGQGIISNLVIDWGDGSIPETLPADAETAQHTYLCAADLMEIRVRATDAHGVYGSAVFQVPVVNRVNRPYSLIAAAASSRTVQLTWTDDSTEATGYEIEQSPDGLNFILANTVAPGVTASLIEGLNDDTIYYFRVRAVNGVYASPYSNVADVTLPLSIPDVSITGDAHAFWNFVGNKRWRTWRYLRLHR